MFGKKDSMTGDKLAEALLALAQAIKDGNQQIVEELKEVKKVAAARNPLDFDPEKLKASTKDVKEVRLKEIQPQDPSRPNLGEPWPDPRVPKPPLVRG
jgi:hypothetical protein